MTLQAVTPAVGRHGPVRACPRLGKGARAFPCRAAPARAAPTDLAPPARPPPTPVPAGQRPGQAVSRALAATLAAAMLAGAPLDAAAAVTASTAPGPAVITSPSNPPPGQASSAAATPPALVLPSVAPRPAPLTREELTTVNLFKKAAAGVVLVTSLTPRTDALTSATLDMPQASGSGVIWDAAGHIVTNAHVVRGAAAVSVTFLGGREARARIVGVDPDKDVAVLEVLDVVDPAERAALFKPIPLGTSAGLQVGQKVYVIGNPFFGLQNSFSSGLLSGVGREIPSGVSARPIGNMLQVEAAVNPGNSGGAALSSAGELIGIPTAIYSASGTSAGVGFAVPVDAVASSANALIRTGKVVRPMLGISLAPEPAADGLGVKGVLILGTQPGGAAAAAGLKATSRDEYGRPVFGDIIRGFNGADIGSPADLYRQLDKVSPGDEVELRVLRGSGEETVKVTLQASA